MTVAPCKGITLKTTHQFLSVLFSEDVHAKRIYSLANATLGVISSASLAVNTIGLGLESLINRFIDQLSQVSSGDFCMPVTCVERGFSGPNGVGHREAWIGVGGQPFGAVARRKRMRQALEPLTQQLVDLGRRQAVAQVKTLPLPARSPNLNAYAER
jgi:hypothetical protein